MGVVVYTCDTCGREKMVVRNKKGLEHIGRCNITLACRGKMIQTNLFPSYKRGDITEPVEGLDEWYPRKILHNHDQSIDSKEWVVSHNFGTDPAVIAYIDNDINDDRIEVTPEEIEIISPETLKIKFNKAYSGVAQLIARQSHPNLFNPIPEPLIEEETSRIITTDGQWTVGTRMNSVGISSIIRIRVTYVSGNDDPYQVEYDIDDIPAYPSPWSDYERVSIKGQLYTVRSFKFHHSQMTRNGKIKPGAYAYISLISETDTSNFRPIEKEEVVILLANEPYKSIDKNRFIYIDAFDALENTTSLVYNDTVLYCLPDIIKSIHPPIQKA